MRQFVQLPSVEELTRRVTAQQQQEQQQQQQLTTAAAESTAASAPASAPMTAPASIMSSRSTRLPLPRPAGNTVLPSSALASPLVIDTGGGNTSLMHCDSYVHFAPTSAASNCAMSPVQQQPPTIPVPVAHWNGSHTISSPNRSTTLPPRPPPPQLLKITHPLPPFTQTAVSGPHYYTTPSSAHPSQQLRSPHIVISPRRATFQCTDPSPTSVTSHSYPQQRTQQMHPQAFAPQWNGQSPMVGASAIQSPLVHYTPTATNSVPLSSPRQPQFARPPKQFDDYHHQQQQQSPLSPSFVMQEPVPVNTSRTRSSGYSGPDIADLRVPAQPATKPKHVEVGPRGYPTGEDSGMSVYQLRHQMSQVKKRPRRRYEEVERMYNCNWPGCTKSYGTLNHLNAHVLMQKHGPKRLATEFKEIRAAYKLRKLQEQKAAASGTSDSGVVGSAMNGEIAHDDEQQPSPSPSSSISAEHAVEMSPKAPPGMMQDQYYGPPPNGNYFAHEHPYQHQKQYTHPLPHYEQ